MKCDDCKNNNFKLRLGGDIGGDIRNKSHIYIDENEFHEYGHDKYPIKFQVICSDDKGCGKVLKSENIKIYGKCQKCGSSENPKMMKVNDYEFHETTSKKDYEIKIEGTCLNCKNYMMVDAEIRHRNLRKLVEPISNLKDHIF